ncbi:MAG: endolytic transglycosylase MltG, partial [Cellvibrionaceae bacterium]|nr:endolytic transglycosylase MltG [Cellvibrionaceae bacterium]
MQKALGLLLSPRLWLGLLLALVFSGLATYWWASTRLAQPINLPEPDYIYTVADGSHLAGLAKDLEAKGIIPSALLLRVYARLSQQQSIHRGEFALDQSLNSMTLLAKLCSSDVVQHRITLLEGWRYQQALDYLHSKQNIKAELKGLDWAAQQQKLGFELAHPEGYFFPDTYRYHAGESDVSILRRAHRKLNWVLAQ